MFKRQYCPSRPPKTSWSWHGSQCRLCTDFIQTFHRSNTDLSIRPIFEVATRSVSCELCLLNHTLLTFRCQANTGPVSVGWWLWLTSCTWLALIYPHTQQFCTLGQKHYIIYPHSPHTSQFRVVPHVQDINQMLWFAIISRIYDGKIKRNAPRKDKSQ